MEDLITFVDEFTAPKRTFKLMLKDATLTAIAKLFHVAGDTVVLVESVSKRAIIPAPDGKIEGLRPRQTYKVEGECPSSSASSFSPGAASPFGWSASGRLPQPLTPDVRGSRAENVHAFSSSPTAFSSPQSTWKRPSSSHGHAFGAPAGYSHGSGSMKMNRMVVLVRFDGTTKANGSRNYKVLQTFSVRLQHNQLNKSGLQEAVEKRLKDDGVDDEVILTDASGCALSVSTSETDLHSPNKRILCATVKNYERHFGKSTMTLKERLTYSPVKPQQSRRSQAALSDVPAHRKKRRLPVSVVSSSDSDDGTKVASGYDAQPQVPRVDYGASLRSVDMKLEKALSALARLEARMEAVSSGVDIVVDTVIDDGRSADMSHGEAKKPRRTASAPTSTFARPPRVDSPIVVSEEVYGDDLFEDSWSPPPVFDRYQASPSADRDQASPSADRAGDNAADSAPAEASP